MDLSKIAAEFYDQASKEWDLDGISEERKEINARMLGPILPTVRTILDVGCGSGAIAAWYGGMGYLVVGMDICPAMIKHAVLRPKGASVVEYFVEDICRDLHPGRHSAAYDLVMFNDSLEHTINPKTALENGCRVAKTWLYLTFPTAEYRLEHGLEGQIVDWVLPLDWVMDLLEANGFPRVMMTRCYYGDDKYWAVLAKRGPTP